MEGSIARAKEKVMLRRLCAALDAFYDNEENIKAFEKWKENKNAKNNTQSHNDF